MEGSRKCWVLNGLETDSESEIDGHLDVKIIGKKLYYTFDFLIFTEKRGFPFFLARLLIVGSYFCSRMILWTELTQKHVSHANWVKFVVHHRMSLTLLRLFF